MPKRKITAEEALGIQNFLTSGKSLDTFISDLGLDRTVVDQALKETGITLPEQGAATKITRDEAKLYTDIVQSGQNLMTASENLGFDLKTAQAALEQNNLSLPREGSRTASRKSGTASTRTITDEEALGIRNFLSSDKTFDQFVDDLGLDRTVVDQALKETGITLPGRGLGNRFTGDELQLFTDVLQSGQNVFSASQSMGFDVNAAVAGLEEANLRVPLSSDERQVFDVARDLDLTTSDVSEQLSVTQDSIDLALRGAGLSLPGPEGVIGRTPAQGNPLGSTSTTDRGGASGTNFLASKFAGVPQAPGGKLGFLNLFKERKNPNLLTGPRGVTRGAKTRVNKLSGSL